MRTMRLSERCKVSLFRCGQINVDAERLVNLGPRLTHNLSPFLGRVRVVP